MDNHATTRVDPRVSRIVDVKTPCHDSVANQHIVRPECTAEQARTALGFAGTQAAGLKAQAKAKASSQDFEAMFLNSNLALPAASTCSLTAPHRSRFARTPTSPRCWSRR